jgi:hypothetical protein
MWGYTSFDLSVPYDIFDFRVSRHRDGPAELLSGYGGYAVAVCYSGNKSVILSPESKMTRMAYWAHMHAAMFTNKLLEDCPLAPVPRQNSERSCLVFRC